MKRRDALKAMAGAAVSSAWALAARAAQDPAGEVPLPQLMAQLGPMMNAVPIAVATLTPGLSTLAGPGGNIAALVGPDGLVMVDSFVPSRAADLLPVVRKLDAGPITLINTHWHFDHTGGNAALAGAGARIIAHENARKRLGSDQYNADFEMKIPPSPPAALPAVTVGSSTTLYLNGEEIHLAHVPRAHTDGDVFVHFRKANVLHTGDLFTNGFYPNIDSSSDGWVGGMVAAADRMLGVVDARTRIIPGHGPIGNREDLAAFRDMLAEARAKVEPLVAAGKTPDEAIAARPLASLDARWAKGLFKGSHFTRLVYSGLVKHRDRPQSRP